MRWIREHKLASGLLTLLLVLVIIFVVSIVLGGSNPLTGVINDGTAGVSGFLSSVGDGVRDQVTGLFSHGQLQDRIEELEEENAQLERELASARLEENQLAQLSELAELLNYDYIRQGHEVVTADVTLFDGSNWTNTFTIDRGTEAGIAEGMIVVNGSGLVGRVEDAGEGWAKVVSIIDSGTHVSFELSRDDRQLGIVTGNSQGYISGYMLDEDSTVAEGDILLTSGMGTFPEGLEIGSVRSVTNNSNTLIKEITVEPSVDFNSLRKVAVIL